jgi:hypothetical protein
MALSKETEGIMAPYTKMIKFSDIEETTAQKNGRLDTSERSYRRGVMHALWHIDGMKKMPSIEMLNLSINWLGSNDEHLLYMDELETESKGE